MPIALVLAGGQGKRCWPITGSKPLIRFRGKALIEFTLDSLAKAGIKQVLVVTNQENNMRIRDLKVKSLDIETVVQKEPKGMADALLLAKKKITGKSVLVVNAADLVDYSLFSSILKKAKSSAAPAIIPGLKMVEHFKGGYLRLKKGKVIEIVEKPKPGSEPSNMINLVAHYFNDLATIVELIKKTASDRDDVYELAVSQLLKEHPADLIEYREFFAFIKHPWDILAMSELILKNGIKKIDKTAQIHETAIIEGNVTIEKEAKILEHAVIKGPSYIGENSIIGNNAMVLNSSIESNCTIGFSTEVARSYLGPGCWLHANYIGDSVLEEDNHFGAGAVTANFRFDKKQIRSRVNDSKISTGRKKFGAIVGKSARVGVNASLMPGIKIGSRALVGPGVVQYQDLKAKMQVFLPQAKDSERN